jgi:Tannase and feruloyl esterase
MRTSAVIFFAVALCCAAARGEPGDACGRLIGTTLPHTTLTIAESVPAGKFAPPSGPPLDKVPAFCRVTGVIKPSSDSYIRFEVWMPASGWNQKFLGVGNGGFAGSIGYGGMGGNLRRGYATAATDTGHEGDAEDASWAFHHPEKVTDFGYRGLHETMANAKALIEAFYGKAPGHSYFDSCSDGGREALMEAQRFPEDFDGILAGAPANNWTHMLAGGIGVMQGTYGKNPAGYISSMKLPAIGAAVRAACDVQDGVKDGIINNPAQCHFDPTVLLCKGEESRSCLTAPQIAALKVLYTVGGFAPGGEDVPNGWSSWVIGPGPGGNSGASYLQNYFRYMVFEDPAWNPLNASVETAERAAAEKTGHALDATDPDLHKFEERGGKLIVYHGWSDPAISPLNSIHYYQSVAAKMGEGKAGSFTRLYMVPGMQHCIGGPGPNWFGQLGTVTAKGAEHGIYAALENWVETGAAPGDIIATKYVADSPAKGVAMTRPLCAYPQVAKYKGTGDVNDAANFACAAF